MPASNTPHSWGWQAAVERPTTPGRVKFNPATAMKPDRHIQHLHFDNRFMHELPGDPQPENTRRQVFGACYSRVQPIKVPSPRLVAFSLETAALVGLDEADCRSPLFTQLFSGNRQLPGMEPHALCYGGHQFGRWAGQLGDGRAINLGEVLTSTGEHQTLQLKGAGPTPYSRTADGLAVLRSSLREFLCSEAMHHLGIPTTRALSLILTGNLVERDMFYDGHPQEEPGAIVCRVAPSFLRFGNFELLAARGETDLLRQLADHTIRAFFPHLGAPEPEVYVQWFTEICKATAALMVDWMRVGFVHGVMNTDNMSILGLTIDYGPYGWLEDYDPTWTPNTTDAAGRRYCYGRQPQIAQWNLAQMANAIYPLVGAVPPLEEALHQFTVRYDQGWWQAICAKLGFADYKPETDNELIRDLLRLLPEAETDMTLFFRQLAQIPAGLPSAPDELAWEERIRPLLPAYYHPDQWPQQYREQMTVWLDQYQQRLAQDGLPRQMRQQAMEAVNPKYVLRNYLAQQAIDRVMQDDMSAVDELLEVLRHPYDEQPGNERFAEKRPEWARNRPGCSMLSCSS